MEIVWWALLSISGLMLVVVFAGMSIDYHAADPPDPPKKKKRKPKAEKLPTLPEARVIDRGIK